MSRPILRTVVMSLSLGAVAAAAGHAAAQEPPSRAYITDERKPPPSTRWKLIGGGVATTFVFYAVAQPFSYAWPDAPGGMDLRIPVAGPWIALSHEGCPSDDPDCSLLWPVVRSIFTILDGIGQAGGLGIAFEGLFLSTEPERQRGPSRPLRRSPSDPKDKPAEPGNLFWAPSPMHVGQHGVGLGVVGLF